MLLQTLRQHPRASVPVPEHVPHSDQASQQSQDVAVISEGAAYSQCIAELTDWLGSAKIALQVLHTFLVLDSSMPLQITFPRCDTHCIWAVDRFQARTDWLGSRPNTSTACACVRANDLVWKDCVIIPERNITKDICTRISLAGFT